MRCSLERDALQVLFVGQQDNTIGIRLVRLTGVRIRRGRRSRRNIVVGPMAVHAAHALVRMHGMSPLRPGLASVVLVTMQAEFGSHRGAQLLEVVEHALLLTASFQMPAGRSVARLARLPLVTEATVNIALERLGVDLMASPEGELTG